MPFWKHFKLKDDQEYEEIELVFKNPGPVESYKVTLVNPEHYENLIKEVKSLRNIMEQIYSVLALSDETLKEKELGYKSHKQAWEYVRKRLNKLTGLLD